MGQALQCIHLRNFKDIKTNCMVTSSDDLQPNSDGLHSNSFLLLAKSRMDSGTDKRILVAKPRAKKLQRYSETRA